MDINPQNMDTKFTSQHTAFHSFCVYPSESVEDQRKDEVIVLRLRAHPLTQLPWVINTIFLVVIAIILIFFLPDFLVPAQITVFNAFAFVFIYSYAWVNFLLWFFNVGIITNERVIDIDFYNVLYREFTATNIGKIADVTAKIGGFFGSFFQFGNVFVKTEGGDVQNIEFEAVPRPSDAVYIINELVVEAAEK